ncbi:hypothetical protein [Cytobacillus firmus]|uniref:Uncharacterized protein n=1 Tax=Cytobacillus firmus DS1 TaxID=1307436 RepID=W7KRP0_CYTFI|nr:hypothetical protein [Cytobacillus firmus]EWG08778.1 hypothetical protein PBF_22347 [Cytobacillus firmus DS1]
MYMYFRSVWISFIMLSLLFMFKGFIESNIIAYGLACMIMATYIFHIFSTKRQYASANLKGYLDFSELPKTARIENTLYAALETLIVVALLIINTHIELLSIVLFFIGGSYLVFIHLRRNKEEYDFYNVGVVN